MYVSRERSRDGTSLHWVSKKCLRKHYSQSRLSVLGADFRGLEMQMNTGT